MSFSFIIAWILGSFLGLASFVYLLKVPTIKLTYNENGQLVEIRIVKMLASSEKQ